MRRRRVDWEGEIRKTDRIRKRGFALSALSLAVALGVIFGVGRMGGIDVSVPRRVVAIACLILGIFLFRVVLRRRERLRREREEREFEERQSKERES